MSTTVYSQVLIYTAESTGASMERTKMPNLRNGSKGDSNPGSLYCESGILPLTYCAPQLKLTNELVRYVTMNLKYTLSG